MRKNLSSISVARQLHEQELYYVTPMLIADLFGVDRRRAYSLIARLQADGLVDEIERGKHLLLGLEPERVLSNPLFIGSQMVVPSYISYWSALHYYGLTEQVPRTTFVATTKKKQPVTYRDLHFQFVSVKPHKFFGYRRERLGDLPVVVADEAKAIVDSLDLPGYAGSIDEVARALHSSLEGSGSSRVDAGTLIEYANRMQNKTLNSRLGYLLELFGHAADGLAGSDSPVKLDPSRHRAGPTVTRWQVVVNLPDRQIATWAGAG
jgi:predicted transcriptional regulator of viral defense system